jgi:hypothetical protein
VTGYEVDTDQVNGRVFPALRDMLTYISDQLTQTAITYYTAEKNAKHKVVAAGVGQGGGTGIENPLGGEEGKRPRQAPVELGFTNGAEVNPKPPDDPHLTDWVEDKLNDLLGPVAELVKKFTGYDIVAEWTPVVLGDWGAGYRIADAWTEVAHSLRAIGADLDGGLALLSAHWTAADGGGAAAAFARFAHGKTGVVTVFAELADAVSEAVKDLTVNPKTWIDLGEELWGIVEDYIEFIKTTFEALKTCVELIVQMGELAIEVIDLIAVTLEWKLGGN